MYKSLVNPGKYCQGKNIMNNIYEYVSFIGKRFLIIVDSVVVEIIKDKIEEGFNGTEGEYEFILFMNESTEEEAMRIAKIAQDKNVDGIIGAGGGKAIDTAKFVCNICDIPLVVIPTSASSDAPCSAASVIYNGEGTFLYSSRMKRNPDLVLVDTMIIDSSPVRLLIAGMGDAFATFYEARACDKSGALNYTGGRRTEGAYALAKLCNDILLEYGFSAKKSVENKEWSESLEKIVEANIYLSGVGFENNGCAIAHAFYNGMTSAIKPFTALHGEGVAFGTIVQLITEYLVSGNWNHKEFDEVVNFYKSVGLPLTFRELNINNVDDKMIMDIAIATCTSGTNAHKMPFEVTPEVIRTSLVRLNKLFN
jgi:glycerol dehydrogenase